jgi:signal transduction histidine kinase
MATTPPISLLLIEDNAAESELVVDMLAQTQPPGFHVRHARRLDHAIDMLNQEQFDVVLLDLGLPDASGLDGLEALLHTASRAAVVVRTGLGDEEIAIRAIQEGAQDYIVKKPTWSADELQRSLHYAIARSQAEQLKSEISAAREATARQADLLKSELVATVSHELRTPLACVVGFTELMLRDQNLDEETRERYLQIIHDESMRLTGLINDFLDMDKMQAGHFTLALAPFELGELLRHEVKIFSALSATHKLDLADIGEPLAIVGDRSRMGQVVANLISNAIKYSPAGGAVSITASPGDSFTRVSVRDSGLGIPADQQASIFTKFFRVDSSDTREIRGTGLGLALCQEIVHAHGGRIGFDSTEGQGSTFWLELPTTGLATAGDERPRVLVIEDNPSLATLLAECLALDGLAADCVPTGELGLERACAYSPAVICIGSITLPGEIDGWQVLARLKENPATAHIPVIVCTAERGRKHTVSAGAAEFVAKPFASEQLRDAVARQLTTAST